MLKFEATVSRTNNMTKKNGLLSGDCFIFNTY